MNDHLTPFDNVTQDSLDLLADLRGIISRGKSQAVAVINSTLTLTYWHVGKRINDDVLKGERATYGKQVIPSLVGDLVQENGRSFEAKNLLRIKKLA